MNLQIDIEQEQELTTIFLSGEIDIYTAPKLKEAMLPLFDEKGKTVEIDLEDVGYMDSTGIGTFVSALKASNANGSHLRLVNMQDRVLRLFSITGLDEIMDINAAIKGGHE